MVKITHLNFIMAGTVKKRIQINIKNLSRHTIMMKSKSKLRNNTKPRMLNIEEPWRNRKRSKQMNLNYLTNKGTFILRLKNQFCNKYCKNLNIAKHITIYINILNNNSFTFLNNSQLIN